MSKDWGKAQTWEASWWGDCLNTYGEEEKQIVYAKRMGLRFYHNKKSPYNIDMQGKAVLDLGGGPTSLLLKCDNLGPSVVVDPLEVPDWVKSRYELAGIVFSQVPAEDITLSGFDEVWIYNCLQHTRAPSKIIKNALRAGGIVRIFEWVHTAKNEGHPHAFVPATLDQWLGGEGKRETLKGEAGCFGDCYYGVFVGTGLDE